MVGDGGEGVLQLKDVVADPAEDRLEGQRGKVAVHNHTVLL